MCSCVVQKIKSNSSCLLRNALVMSGALRRGKNFMTIYSSIKKTPANVMPAALRAEINADPEYLRCGLALPHTCKGRITREHAIKYAGKKVQEKWAIPPLCAAGHGVDEFQDAGTEVPKDMREWIAYNRASDEELLAFSKGNYIRERDRLNQKYGVYIAPPIPERVMGIDFGFTAPPVVVRRPFAPVSKEDAFEREVKAYARTNRVPIEEARATLMELA